MRLVKDVVNLTREMSNMGFVAVVFAMCLVVFTFTFVVCYYLWPIILTGYFLATWASGVGIAVAAWATFKLWMTLAVLTVISFVGMFTAPLIHENLRNS